MTHSVSDSKAKHNRNISLSPLTFEMAVKGLLAVEPKAAKSPKKAQAKKKAGAKKRPAKKARKK